MKTLFMLIMMFDGNSYIVDHDLTREDCAKIILDAPDMIEVSNPHDNWHNWVKVPGDTSYLCKVQS